MQVLMIDQTGIVIILCSVFFFMACQGEPTPKPMDGVDQQRLQKIQSLHSDELQEAFLLDLFRRDQYLRLRMDSITQQYGYRSPEWVSLDSSMWVQDSVNVLDTEIFLKTYGYPDRERFSELAVHAPWAVIHHIPDYQTSVRLYPLLRSAYESGKLEAGEMLFFLSRTYRDRFGEEFKLEGKFWPEEKIDTLTQLLGFSNESE